MRVLKQVFVKITGVTPEELAKLHGLCKDELHQMAEHKVFFQKGSSDHISDGYPVALEIVASKLDTDHGTYTVELRVNAVGTDICPSIPRFESSGEWELRPAAYILENIWQVLDIFPVEEQFVKVRN